MREERYCERKPRGFIECLAGAERPTEWFTHARAEQQSVVCSLLFDRVSLHPAFSSWVTVLRGIRFRYPAVH